MFSVNSVLAPPFHVWSKGTATNIVTSYKSTVTPVGRKSGSVAVESKANSAAIKRFGVPDVDGFLGPVALAFRNIRDSEGHILSGYCSYCLWVLYGTEG